MDGERKGEPKKKPTLKTIAYMTGLAVTTVSKALKDAPDIKQSTKERVQLIAKEVGYQPDRAGQLLRTGKTNVIALVIDTEAELFSMASDVITGVSEALRNTNYHVVLAPYLHDDDPMKSVRHVVEANAADGVILSSIERNDHRLAYLQEAGLPFTTHGRSSMGIDHAYCDFDCQAFAYDAVKFLDRLGTRKVSLMLPPSQFAYSQFMQDGFYESADATGIEGRVVQADASVYSADLISRRVTELMNKKSRPDGLVCSSAIAAVGAIGGVEAAGLEVGKDVQIVTKQSPANMLRWFGRKVYTIDEDFKATGVALGESLVALIDGAPIADHQRVFYNQNTERCVLCVDPSCLSGDGAHTACVYETVEQAAVSQ